MSVPHFHSDVQLPPLSPPGVLELHAFEVSGPLEKEDDARELYLFVVILQTAKDRDQPLQPNPNATAIAKAFLGPISIPANMEQDWRVSMNVLANQIHFVPGYATGSALTVEYSDDANSIGFETYSWTQRLHLNLMLGS
jgi:hypothetical protein